MIGQSVDHASTLEARRRQLDARRSWPPDPDGGSYRVSRTRAADRLLRALHA
jgi:hypothetical protein